MLRPQGKPAEAGLRRLTCAQLMRSAALLVHGSKHTPHNQDLKARFLSSQGQHSSPEMLTGVYDWEPGNVLAYLLSVLAGRNVMKD